MHDDFMIFAVDDLEVARRLLEASLGKEYALESFACGEDCLQRLPKRSPDLFLLDVDLPGIDGYSLCREIRTRPEFAATPVIFISALDDLESRLQGYDAGGIDFIVKPYRMAELRQKVELARTSLADRISLRRQAEESEMLASLVLANLDEYALLIRFLRALNTCTGSRAVVDALLEMLAGFKLAAAVQLRLRGSELTISAKGENNPLEVSVIQHVRTLGTVFEFKSRAAFNFPKITILVNNMPVHDNDYCGRVRDHLAIAVESADAKLGALQAFSEQEQTNAEINDLLVSLSETVTTFSNRYDGARYLGSALTEVMLDELLAAFAYLAMTKAQEESLLKIVRNRSLELVDLYDFGDATQLALQGIVEHLARIRGNLSAATA